MSDVQEIPAKAEAKGGVIAYLAVDGAVAAAKFYEKAFGAQVAAIHPPDEQGRTMHVHLRLNGGSLMLGDFYPEHGHAKEAPQAFTLTLPVADIEAAFKRAVEAGAQPLTPPQKMFWGDLYASLKDPFGFTWAMDQPAE
jgi:uncharacterized glyoxalase superfamily protein PhnB